MSQANANSTTETEAEVRAAVGENADYFLAQWRRPKRAGYNLAAFVIAGFWLPYRKMHRETAVLFSFALLQSVLTDLMSASGRFRPDTPRTLQLVMTFAIAWVCAAFGNAWYRSHVKRLIGGTRLVEPDEGGRLSLLAAKGGTSVRSALLWTLTTLVVFAGVSFVLKRTLGIPH